MSPSRAVVVAVLAFAAGYVVAGVLLQCIVWDPTEGAVVPVGFPDAEGLVLVAFFGFLSTTAFGGGVGIGRLRSRVVSAPVFARACLRGAAVVVLITLLAWADVEPPAAPTMTAGGGFSFVEDAAPPLTPVERLTGFGLVFGLPGVMGFRIGRAPRNERRAA